MTLVCHILVSLALHILNMNINYEFILCSYKRFIFIFAVLKSLSSCQPRLEINCLHRFCFLSITGWA